MPRFVRPFWLEGWSSTQKRTTISSKLKDGWVKAELNVRNAGEPFKALVINCYVDHDRQELVVSVESYDGRKLEMKFPNL